MEPDDRLGQTRELLDALSGERAWLVLRALIRQPRTPKQLEDDTSLDQPRISRALQELRNAGVLAGVTGRGGAQQVALREEVLEVIQAGDRLAEAVNARRVAEQAAASRQT